MAGTRWTLLNKLNVCLESMVSVEKCNLMRKMRLKSHKGEAVFDGPENIETDSEPSGHLFPHWETYMGKLQDIPSVGTQSLYQIDFHRQMDLY